MQVDFCGDKIKDKGFCLTEATNFHIFIDLSVFNFVVLKFNVYIAECSQLRQKQFFKRILRHGTNNCFYSSKQIQLFSFTNV